MGRRTVAATWQDITGKPASFPAISHQHVCADITDLVAGGPHADDHESGGSDALDLASIAGTITAAQHGTPAGDLHPGYALDADLAAHEGAADPHPGYQRESEKGAANGYPGLDGSTKVPVAQLPTGATSSTVCIGNDSRLSDARTPTTHSITSAHNDFPGGTSNFLRADGTWAAPAGGDPSAAWPVGAIFISVVSTNPATLLGFGTWAAFAAGRVLVGIDAGQTEFDTVRETGGAKTHTLSVAEMPSHTHVEQNNSATTGGLAGWGARDTSTSTPVATGYSTQATGGDGAHNNLQPYIVVYMWERTA